MSPFRLLLLALALSLAVAPVRAAAPGVPPRAAPLYEGKPLRHWLGELQAKDVLARDEAIEVLADAGPVARQAVPALEELLRAGPPDARRRAALALWRIDGRTGPAVAALAEELRAPGPLARGQALQALLQMGPAAAPAASAVLELVDDLDFPPFTRFRAVAALRVMGPAAAPAFREALADKAVRRRRNAVTALAELGPRAEEMVPALSGRLKDDDQRVRVGAARALWLVGQTTDAVMVPLLWAARHGDAVQRHEVFQLVISDERRPRAALPLLRESLKYENAVLQVGAADALWAIEGRADEVRPVYLAALRENRPNEWPAAARGLGRLGPAAKEAAPRLVQMLRSVKGPLVAELSEPLGRIGTAALPPLCDLLRDETAPASARQPAIDALGRMGPDAVPLLAPLLAHATPRVRAAGCEALGGIGPAGAAASAPLLLARLQDDDPAVRRAARVALGRLGAGGRSALPRLIETAGDRDVAVRLDSLEALGQLEAAPRAVLPVALAALKDEDARVRVRGLELLWQVERHHKQLGPSLAALLGSPDTRSPALQLVRRMGADAEQAVPALVRLLDDKDPTVRREAGKALGHVAWSAEGKVSGRDAAILALLAALKQKDDNLRGEAVYALRWLRAPKKDVVPPLVEVLKEAGPASRDAVLHYLAEIGPEGAAAVPGLCELLKAPDPFVRLRAAEVLGRIDPRRGRREGAPVARALLNAPHVRLHAARALWALEPDDKEARAALLAGLRDRFAAIRLLACDLLGTLGPDARAAVPHLRKALRDPDARVRIAAAEPLARIAGDRRASIDVLVEVVAQPGPLPVRLRAAGALGGMGPAAKAALPALRKAQSDREPRLRPAARQAVRLIAPEEAREAPEKR